MSHMFYMWLCPPPVRIFVSSSPCDRLLLANAALLARAFSSICLQSCNIRVKH